MLTMFCVWLAPPSAHPAKQPASANGQTVKGIKYAYKMKAEQKGKECDPVCLRVQAHTALQVTDIGGIKKMGEKAMQRRKSRESHVFSSMARLDIQCNCNSNSNSIV